jgi:hypothetical protein
LHASYGDKWSILSFLAEHLILYSNSFVIACHQDRGLIEIFLGPTTTAERFNFIDQEHLNKLSGFFRIRDRRGRRGGGVALLSADREHMRPSSHCYD